MIAEAIIAAVLSGNAVCSDYFPKTNRLNPTTLSERGHCLAHTVFADKQSGIMEFQVWVKILDKVYSVPLQELTKTGSKSAALVKFKELIGEQIELDFPDEVERVITKAVEQSVVENEVTVAVEEVVSREAIIEQVLSTGDTNTYGNIQSIIDGETYVLVTNPESIYDEGTLVIKDSNGDQYGNTIIN